MPHGHLYGQDGDGEPGRLPAHPASDERVELWQRGYRGEAGGPGEEFLHPEDGVCLGAHRITVPRVQCKGDRPVAMERDSHYAHHLGRR